MAPAATSQKFLDAAKVGAGRIARSSLFVLPVGARPLLLDLDARRSRPRRPPHPPR